MFWKPSAMKKLAQRPISYSQCSAALDEWSKLKITGSSHLLTCEGQHGLYRRGSSSTSCGSCTQ